MRGPPRAPSSSGLTRGSTQDAARVEFATLHHLAEGRPADPRVKPEDDGWGGGVEGYAVLDADERFVKHARPTQSTVILGLEPRIYPRCRSGRVYDLHHLAEGRPADSRDKPEDDGSGGGVEGMRCCWMRMRGWMKMQEPTQRSVILGLAPRIYPRCHPGRVCDPAPSRGGKASRSSGQARG